MSAGPYTDAHPHPGKALTAKIRAPPGQDRDPSLLAGCCISTEGLTEALISILGVTFILYAYPQERLGVHLAQTVAKGAIGGLEKPTDLGSLEKRSELH